MPCWALEGDVLCTMDMNPMSVQWLSSYLLSSMFSTMPHSAIRVRRELTRLCVLIMIVRSANAATLTRMLTARRCLRRPPIMEGFGLRISSHRGEARSLAAAGLVIILSICLTIYSIASFKEGGVPKAPSLALTGWQKVADNRKTVEGWASFTGGWNLGSLSGVAWAYTLLYILNLPYPVKEIR
ncbi:hypothetical protein M758_UG106900 [Ceratodon purpureus]|nr:hypothetical protein M758_UG106900 [Ceratodon purpureus]